MYYYTYLIAVSLITSIAFIYDKNAADQFKKKSSGTYAAFVGTVWRCFRSSCTDVSDQAQEPEVIFLCCNVFNIGFVD